MSDLLAEQLRSSLSAQYEIERELGRGGMATVYLARDLKHDRRVALKVLDPDLGVVLGAERFLSEIRVTANLQHPNLLPLFDSGEVNGLLYYVMPYVEGESLRHRLDRERELPVEESIRIATAIARALEYAHGHGVIHRDLKPENILLQHGQPIVADFGIALAISKAGGQRVTQTGLSLGTPQYMSPEQATGDRVIDARSDIYSLGAVTYEMLGGEAPHVGSSSQAIMAKLMTEPARPLAMLRPSVPEHVDEAVLRALEKVPADRFATAGQFADALNGAIPAGHRPGTRVSASRRRASRAMMIGLVASSALALAFLGLWIRAASRPDPKPVQFVVDLPSDMRVMTANERAVTVSPDGGMLAYLAKSRSTSATGIFVRPLDSLRARPEAIDGMAPLFSPDGRWLYYYKLGSAILRVPVRGGSTEIVTPLTDWQGYALSSRGDVLFAQSGSIWRVGDKGTHERLVSPDTTNGEQSLADPSFLDDNTIGFWIQRSDGDPAKGTGITTLKGGEHTVVNLPGSRMFGMLDGHVLVGTEQGSLLAYPFDLRRRSVTGPPVVLLDSAVWIITGSLQISLADDGTLAYLRGRSGGALALVDNRGGTIVEAPERATFGQAALSPDGKRVAVAIARNTTGGRNVQTGDIWIWDIAANTMAKFTSDGGLNPAWSADGKRIAFTHNTSPQHSNIMWAPTDGSSPPELLVEVPDTLWVGPFSFARGGRELLANVRHPPSTNTDIYSVDLTGTDRALHPLIATRFAESSGTVSPDGHWLAYVSNESGRAEVYVRPYASPAGRIRVSAKGGATPQWLANGSRLVYSDGGQSLIADIAQSAGTGGAITSVVRDSLSREGTRLSVDGSGSRVVVGRTPSDWRIVVVKNWVQAARRKLRAK